MFYLEDYIGYLVAERGASPATVSAYRGDLQKYCLFLESERDVHEASLVQRKDVAAFVADMSNRGFAPSTIERRLSVAKGYHRFLVREGFAEADPTQTVPLPRKPHTLPDVLSELDPYRNAQCMSARGFVWLRFARKRTGWPRCGSRLLR